MNLFILRHGEAVIEPHPNDDRPLTDKGRLNLKKVSPLYSVLLPDVDLIWSSPLERARDTAEIVVDSLPKGTNIDIVDHLLPGVPGDVILNSLKRLPEDHDVLLVGHEPNLSELISLLVGTPKFSLDLKKGSICRIKVDNWSKAPCGTLKWHITNRQLRCMMKCM